MKSKKFMLLFSFLFLLSQLYYQNILTLHFAHSKDLTSIKKSIHLYEKKKTLTTAETFELAVLYHTLSLQTQGNIDLPKKTLKILTQAQELYKKDNKSKNPEIEVYIGSTYTLIARDSVKIKDKIYNTNLGLSYMDRVVRKNKNNLKIRVIRISNNIKLPLRFKRKPKIIDDIKFIAKTDLQNNKALLQRAYYFLGESEKNPNLKNQFFQKSYSLDPLSEIGKRSKNHVR